MNGKSTQCKSIPPKSISFDSINWCVQGQLLACIEILSEAWSRLRCHKNVFGRGMSRRSKRRIDPWCLFVSTIISTAINKTLLGDRKLMHYAQPAPSECNSGNPSRIENDYVLRCSGDTRHYGLPMTQTQAYRSASGKLPMALVESCRFCPSASLCTSLSDAASPKVVYTSMGSFTNSLAES